jgi:hypothetical protein
MRISIADAFDLPDWLGTTNVVWRADSSFVDSALVRGQLQASTERRQQLDLLAVDAAYPRLVCPESERALVHQAWHYGELTLLDVDARLSAAVPGTEFDPNLMCEALRRLAKAVGAPPHHFTVAVTL